MTNILNADHYPWKILETIKIFLLVEISGAVLYLYTMVTFDIDSRNPYLYLVFNIITSFALLFSVLYVAKNKYKTAIKDALNLQSVEQFKLCIYAFIGISMAIILRMLIPKLSTAHSFTSQMVATNNLAFTIAIFNGVFIAPICEEIYWRGFVYPVVKKRFSLTITIFIISLLVTLVHFPELGSMWDALIKVLLGNVIFTLLRYRTNSTLSCIITHISYNATIAVIPIIIHFITLEWK